MEFVMEDVVIIKKVNIENISNDKIKASIEVDDNYWINSQEKTKKNIFSNIEINGFRKGEAPENIAKNYVNSEAIFQQAINDILPSVFNELLTKNKIKPISQPRAYVEKFSTTNLVVCFDIFVIPKAEICDYKNINIEYPKINVTKEEINESINELFKQKSEYVSKDGPAKKGDQITLDFEGFIDGKPFDGGKATKYNLVIGSESFIPGFEEQLINSKKDDKKEINVTFPNDYMEPLKGKNATFKCFIHDVKKIIIPEINDENIAKLKILNIKTKEELEKYQKNVLLERKKNESDSKYFNKIMLYIIENSKVKISEELINNEIESMKHKISNGNEDKWKKYLDDKKQKEEEVLDDFRKEIKSKITNAAVFEEIIEKEKISVTDEDINNEYKRVSDLYKMSIERVKEIFSKNLDYVKIQIINDKIRKLLIKYNYKGKK